MPRSPVRTPTVAAILPGEVQPAEQLRNQGPLVGRRGVELGEAEFRLRRLGPRAEQVEAVRQGRSRGEIVALVRCDEGAGQPRRARPLRRDHVAEHRVVAVDPVDSKADVGGALCLPKQRVAERQAGELRGAADVELAGACLHPGPAAGQRQAVRADRKRVGAFQRAIVAEVDGRGAGQAQLVAGRQDSIEVRAEVEHQVAEQIRTAIVDAEGERAPLLLGSQGEDHCVVPSALLEPGVERHAGNRLHQRHLAFQAVAAERLLADELVRLRLHQGEAFGGRLHLSPFDPSFGKDDNDGAIRQILVGNGHRIEGDVRPFVGPRQRTRERHQSVARRGLAEEVLRGLCHRRRRVDSLERNGLDRLVGALRLDGRRALRLLLDDLRRGPLVETVPRHRSCGLLHGRGGSQHRDNHRFSPLAVRPATSVAHPATLNSRAPRACRRPSSSPSS